MAKVRDGIILPKIMNLKSISNRKIFFIDGDGTLTFDTKIIKGADNILERLKAKNYLFYILTNNSSKTEQEHLLKFKKAGLSVKKENILISTQSLIDYLFFKKIKNIHLLANINVTKYFKKRGFVVNEKNPQAIILTYDTEINYQKIKEATYLLNSKLPYYATHIDMLCPSIKGLIPDIGTFINMFKEATGRMPDKTFGKPLKDIIKPVLLKHKLEYKDSVIIGDRLYTDIKMANNSKMISILVLSGETNKSDIKSSKIKPDVILNNIGELIKIL